MEIEIKIKVTEEDIDDICCTAFEGGINYWVDYVKYTSDDYASEYVAKGGSITMYGFDDDEEFRLDRNVILNGIEKYISEFGSENLISDGKIETYNIDAEIADCIVQLGLFGEIVYG